MQLTRILSRRDTLSQEQRRLEIECWQSIKACRDLKGQLASILITTAPKSKDFFEPWRLEGEKTMCLERITRRRGGYENSETITIDYAERSLSVRCKPAYSYGDVVNALLMPYLDIVDIDPDFNTRLPTVDYQYFEDLKQKRLEDLAQVLEAPVEPLLLILEALA